MDNELRKPDLISSEDYRRLEVWERRMIGLFTAAMFTLFAATLLTVSLRLSGATVKLMFLSMILLFVLPGIFLQFSARCPRCGARLGFQTRLVLPDKCSLCGVALKSRP